MLSQSPTSVQGSHYGGDSPTNGPEDSHCGGGSSAHEPGDDKSGLLQEPRRARRQPSTYFEIMWMLNVFALGMVLAVIFDMVFPDLI